jgi:apolipoprotein N-acyltransferase
LIKAFYFFFLGSVGAWLTELPLGGWWLILDLTLFIHTVLISDRPFRQAWLFGLGYFVSALWWIYISLHDIGRMFAPLAIFAVFALSAYLAIFWASAIRIASRLKKPLLRIFALAAAWTITEWLRGYLFTGFPWSGIAESQINGPFYSLAPLAGGLAACFATILLAGFVSEIKVSWLKKIGVISIGLAATYALSFLSFTNPIGQPLQVELVQGNFSQDLKFNPGYIKHQINFYQEAIAQSNAQLVVIPETAFPVSENQIDKDALKTLSRQKYIMAGIVGEPGNNQYANSGLGLGPDLDYYRYDKMHLVPFGEFIPFGFKWFVDAMHMPLGDFYRGPTNQAPFPIKQNNQIINAGIMICYEDAFGSELARRQHTSPHHLWVNLTNLAWFGDSQASKQQLRLAQLRSLETGLPTIRATNTGISSIINQRGEVLAQAPEFTQTTLKAEVQAYQGKTPFVIWQNTPILVFCLGLLLWAWYSNKKSY